MLLYYSDGSEGSTLYSRFLVEQHLGVRLRKSDVVHHIDGDKTNDVLENLEVLSLGDHNRFHARGSTEVVRHICPVCKDSFVVERGRTTFCSQACFKFHSRRAVRPSKEELKALVEQFSFVALGKRFGVSDTAVRKWCKTYNLPYKKKDRVK